jgi:hypothetical protein
MIVSQKKENPWSLYCIYLSNAIHLFKLWNEIYCVVECRGKLFLGIFGSIVSYYRAEAWSADYGMLYFVYGSSVWRSVQDAVYAVLWFLYLIFRFGLSECTASHFPLWGWLCVYTYLHAVTFVCQLIEELSVWVVSLSVAKEETKLNVTWMYTIWISCCMWYFCIVIDFTLM